MNRSLVTLGLVAAVVLGALTAAGLAVTQLPGPLAAGALLCWVAFTLWPWAVLPVGIIGGVTAAVALGADEVRQMVAVHALLLTLGMLALVTRQVAVPRSEGRRPTVADAGMLAVGVLTVLAAGYGLAVGNVPMRVLVAAYHVAVIPLYFFIATYTLNDPRRLRNAGILYVAAAAAITTATMAVPGRHGGIVALLAIPPLIVLVGRTGGWRRIGAVALAALFVTDAVLASYRGMWLAGGLALVVMLVRGSPAVRRGLATTAAAALLLALGSLTLVPGVAERAVVVGVELQQASGYRVPESLIGLAVFSSRPLLGAGLGQTTPDIYLADFAVTDVGPVYHAFYVTVLANLGLIGLCVIIWPVLRALRAGLADRSGLALAFAALTCGFVAAAFFAAPTDGHWELGLLPALTLLTSRWSAGDALPEAAR